MNQATDEEEAAEAAYRAETLRRDSLRKDTQTPLPRCEKARRERSRCYRHLLALHSPLKDLEAAVTELEEVAQDLEHAERERK